MTLLQLHNLTKQFGDVTAVDDLTLSVGDGEVYGFLGPNGAGKSTTINMLLGFMQPTSGSASVFDLDVQDRSVAIRQETGTLLEGYGVYEQLTPLEHLGQAIDTKEATDDPERLLDRVELEADARDRPAGDLSKGLRQRLALAMALVGDPRLLVLDEPTTGLDPNGARMLRRVVREEADRGATVLFSSHIMAQVEAVADRVGILQQGRLVQEGPVSQLRQELDADTTLSIYVEATPEELIGDLRGIDGVSAVAAGEGELTVTCSGGQTKVSVLDRVARGGVGFDDFAIREPSLGDVFSAATEGSA
ncbi:ATP-binding cassette domain-containing protein [Halomicroarcula sp. GCM10025709]|uniref:ABC transporter ATP-binding protein n=1 Tax=Haloarcula TaxID=2237 RepID=UPI0024C34DC3|nr:ABC transporter ATP-binding protein [Halomicroarcula sp. YJ-61-S]